MSLHPADFENGIWTGIAGGNHAVTITESGGKYTIKIGGLSVGTKYTAQIQVVGADKISKASTFTGTTKKYVAPKKEGKILTNAPGTVEFSWKAAVVGKDVPPGAETYDVGIYVNKTIGYVFGADIATYFGDSVKVDVDSEHRKVKVTGLSSQAYTFGIKEIVTIGDFTVESAIAKISATPLKYAAPNVIVPAKGATTLTWSPVKTVMDNQEIIYVVGVYDSKTKTFDANKYIENAKSGEGDNIKSLGLGKIGVQEILKDAVTGKVIAKSAIKVVTVW